METETMGRVLTQATMENLQDLWEAKIGMRTAEQVRRVTVDDAFVDTASTSLALPTRLIKQLGLGKLRQRSARTTAGVIQVSVYEAVRLTIQGRDMITDVIEVPDEVPVLIGQVPLEVLDFIPDPGSGKLIGNPAHGGEQILDLL